MMKFHLLGNGILGNWIIGVRSVGFDEHVVGDPPPGACFYWSPTITDYEGAMTTPVINVGDEPQVLVEFFFELDYWSAGRRQPMG